MQETPPGFPDLDASVGDVRSLRLSRLGIGLWLVVFGMVIFFLPLFLFSSGIRSEVDRLNGDLQMAQQSVELAKTPPAEILTLLDELDSVRQSSSAISSAYSQVSAGFINWPAIIGAIADYREDRMLLASLAQAGNEITVRGRAVSDSSVVTYARALEDSGLFERVVVRSIRSIPEPFATLAGPTEPDTASPVSPTAPISPTFTVTATPTPDLRDEWEEDDFVASDIFVGQSQTHTFYPLYDVDTVKFLAKAGRFYRVQTTELGEGVDTFLTLSLGSATYTNDDRATGDLSSLLVFQVSTTFDVEALVTVTNRGQYGPKQSYVLTVEEVLPTATPLPTGTVPPTATSTITPTPTTTSTATKVPTATETPNLADEYEPDDTKGTYIAIGETQPHTFYPENDVDKVTFLAKSGRRYRVLTSNLASGVDTLLFIMVGSVSYTNDDRQPGDGASEILFDASEPYDVQAVVEI